MSLAAVIDAMIASGCTTSQIGAAVRAYEAEAQARSQAEVIARRAKAAEKKAIQRATLHAVKVDNVPNCPEDIGGQTGTSGDIGGQKKEAPQTPKEKTSPLPSDPKGSSVSAPAGGSNRGHRLPNDWQPDESDLEYGWKLGLRQADFDSAFEDMQRWAWSCTGPKVRKLDWHLTLKGFLKRDAGRLGARAGPPRRGGGQTVSDMARMTDEPEMFDDRDPIRQPDQHHGEPGQGADAADPRRRGFAGRLSVEDAALARRSALVDH